MTKIKFEDGTTVNFQGTPTQSDINEISQQLNIKKPETEKRGWTGEILPVGGAILGGVLGGLAGTAAAPGAGTFAGGVAGAGIGGSLGEAAQEGIEKLTGKRKEISGAEIGKTGFEMGAMEAIGGPLASVGGKLLKGAGETIAKAVIPTSIREAGLVQAYKASKPFWERVLTGVEKTGEKVAETVGAPIREGISKVEEKIAKPITAAETAFKEGLVGTESMIGVQAKIAAKNLWENAISPALKQSKEKVNIQDFLNNAEQQIIKDTPEITRRNSLMDALNSIKEDYKDVGEISLEELQKLKEGWAEFVPEKVYQGKSVAGALNDVRNVLSGNARNTIYNNIGSEMKQAYFDYGNLKGLQELGKKAMTGGKLKGGFGSFWSAVGNMLLTPVGTVGGQAVYKVGQGLEFFGKPGARFLRDIIPGLGEEGKDVSGTTTSENQ